MSEVESKMVGGDAGASEPVRVPAGTELGRAISGEDGKEPPTHFKAEEFAVWAESSLAVVDVRKQAHEIERVATICHEANRAYCATMGDDSQVPWDEAPAWQKETMVEGVIYAWSNPLALPYDSHKSWMKTKQADGWKYGPEKDVKKKLHPCLVPYEDLPKSHRLKDDLFMAVARILRDI